MEQEPTNTEESRCFELLDSYARTRHQCFVSEFFRVVNEPRFSVCFRPVSATKTDERYACKYIQSADEVRAIGAGTALPPSAVERLDAVLHSIR